LRKRSAPLVSRSVLAVFQSVKVRSQIFSLWAI
jgi:hypothetical protein